MATRTSLFTPFPESRADTITTAFPAVARSVRAAREIGAELAAQHGASDQTVENVRLAVSEAATNVVVHAYEQETPGAFRIFASAGNGELLVTIDDDGCGLSSPAHSPGLGSGLQIMRQTAESVRFIERDGGGSTVQLRFRLDA
jgi:serine/threonine-protein kinase RsbW